MATSKDKPATLQDHPAPVHHLGRPVGLVYRGRYIDTRRQPPPVKRRWWQFWRKASRG